PLAAPLHRRRPARRPAGPPARRPLAAARARRPRALLHLLGVQDRRRGADRRFFATTTGSLARRFAALAGSSAAPRGQCERPCADERRRPFHRTGWLLSRADRTPTKSLIPCTAAPTLRRRAAARARKSGPTRRGAPAACCSPRPSRPCSPPPCRRS